MKGILFKPNMIKAIREGRKTQTRRVINPQPYFGKADWHNYECWNYGTKPHHRIAFSLSNHGEEALIGFARYQVGEVVYIKEAFWEDSGDIYYKIDCPTMPTNMFFEKGKWKSPLFLPEIFARYFVQITGVRAEQLQEITHSPFDQDCHAEGFNNPSDLCLDDFMRAWDSINPKYPWSSNPWVWRYEFKTALQ